MSSSLVGKLSIGLLMSVVATTPALGAGAGDIVGKWKTIDDETGEPKSIVTIYEQNGKYFGRVESLFRTPDQDQDPVCDQCAEDDSRRNQKVRGMEIIQDMAFTGERWEGGAILDPANGKIYKCEIWLENGDLKVRGYIFFLFRTQTWYQES
jgi:uncharacterized protein (DUF2147 family)